MFKIFIEKNIHMYNHLLTVVYEGKRYEAICESLPTEIETIAFWPDDFRLDEELTETLIDELSEWADYQNFQYRIIRGARCVSASDIK